MSSLRDSRSGWVRFCYQHLIPNGIIDCIVWEEIPDGGIREADRKSFHSLTKMSPVRDEMLVGIIAKCIIAP